MKIICVENNYSPAIKGDAPILYLKPETAITRSDWPFFVPDWSKQVDFSANLVIRINHLGKSIPERFAHRYYDEVTIGLCFTARDIQNCLKESGLPWEISTGFDGASYIGQWVKLNKDVQSLDIDTQLNGAMYQQFSTSQMLHTVNQIVSYVSQFYLLKTGDLIFTGSPAAKGALKEGDIITASLDGAQLLECRCK